MSFSATEKIRFLVDFSFVSLHLVLEKFTFAYLFQIATENTNWAVSVYELRSSQRNEIQQIHVIAYTTSDQLKAYSDILF